MEATRVALVTCGMSELGTAICRRLDSAGFIVAVSFAPGQRDPQAWLAMQRDDGYRFHAYQVDTGDYADTEWMVQKVLAELGRVDVLVNHVERFCEHSLRSMSPDDWHSVLRDNLDSIFNLSKQVLDGMLERQWGRIINLSSVSAQSGAGGQSAYAAALAGMHGLSKSLALEVARHGITVNTVSPGALRSSDNAAPAQPRSGNVAAIPVGRLGEVAEVAALIDYLASDIAGFVTGANIAINGGQHMC
ncbi:3-oxoacyl-ACP reductase family protein [Massilia sp. PWRC2]|uniref:3-oxoacyl-ACP reductase family protein n=1 Tax=Massilia sp. PWRC2 TaxID=2804626 RepID=UPI003CF5DDFC